MLSSTSASPPPSLVICLKQDAQGRVFMWDRAGNIYYDTEDPRTGVYIVSGYIQLSLLPQLCCHLRRRHCCRCRHRCRAVSEQLLAACAISPGPHLHSVDRRCQSRPLPAWAAHLLYLQGRAAHNSVACFQSICRWTLLGT